MYRINKSQFESLNKPSKSGKYKNALTRLSPGEGVVIGKKEWGFKTHISSLASQIKGHKYSIKTLRKSFAILRVK